ncbi:hypothetical protein EII20_03155 [Comamonadaceae bacterium OH2545_COT-014]|nr:hypothetical protein EII20_03155 [Comamonadaceae bacterium OH2545_COT-014]
MSPHSKPFAPFPLLAAVPPKRFAAELKALEQGMLTLLQSRYVVTQCLAYLAPNGTWVAYVQQADQAARAWKGTRQEIPGRRVGIDLVELWRDPAGARTAALTMTAQPVDTQGHYLLGYFTLAPRQT